MGHFQTTLKQAIFFVSWLHHKLSREEKRQKQNGGNTHEHRGTFGTIGEVTTTIQVGNHRAIDANSGRPTMGQTSDYGDVRCRSLQIVNDEGKTVVNLVNSVHG